jgi:hypothetical protein
MINEPEEYEMMVSWDSLTPSNEERIGMNDEDPPAASKSSMLPSNVKVVRIVLINSPEVAGFWVF